MLENIFQFLSASYKNVANSRKHYLSHWSSDLYGHFAFIQTITIMIVIFLSTFAQHAGLTEKNHTKSDWEIVYGQTQRLHTKTEQSKRKIA